MFAVVLLFTDDFQVSFFEFPSQNLCAPDLKEWLNRSARMRFIGLVEQEKCDLP